MSDNYKERVRQAIENFDARQLKKSQGTTRKNTKPEKTVEAECLLWMRQQKWDVNIYEAKATYDPKRGIYRQQSMRAGTADCMGNTDKGHSAVVEFKAPGKLSTFASPDNIKQQEFIRRKIESGAFACVVDSVQRLVTIYLKWREFIIRGDEQGAKDYLFEMLPTRKFKAIKEEGILWD